MCRVTAFKIRFGRGLCYGTVTIEWTLESLFSVSIVHLFRAWLLLLLLLVASEGRGADDPRRVLSGEIDRNNDIFVLRIAKEEERADWRERKGTRVGYLDGWIRMERKRVQRLDPFKWWSTRVFYLSPQSDLLFFTLMIFQLQRREIPTIRTLFSLLPSFDVDVLCPITKPRGSSSAYLWSQLFLRWDSPR